jgi:hypothetical protein
MSVEQRITCLVTVPGVGFQQPRVGTTPGYADDLHAHLRAALPGLLGAEPLYVVGQGTPGLTHREPGLCALGTWDAQRPSHIVRPVPDRVNDGQHALIHIAPVYAPPEPHSTDVVSLIDVTLLGLGAFGRYTTLPGAARLALCAALAGWRHRHDDSRPAPAGLRVRTDPGFRPTRRVRRQHDPSSARSVLRQIQDDFAAYVCHNEQRERVRGFLREVVLRLAARDDVAHIVVNAHSNGTVPAFDVLRQLPLEAATKIRGFITAGCPLRKYTQLFWWGRDIGAIGRIGPWVNYRDPADPVADPLTPGAGWRAGTAWHPGRQAGLYRSVDPDTGVCMPAALEDVAVDNLAHSRGGGFKAHNYWDNEVDFITPVAQRLRRLTL